MAQKIPNISYLEDDDEEFDDLETDELDLNKDIEEGKDFGQEDDDFGYEAEEEGF